MTRRSIARICRPSPIGASTASSCSRRARTSTTTTQAAAARLGEWLRDDRADAAQRARADHRQPGQGRLGRHYSNAAGDAKRRALAVQEAEHAIRLARIVPVSLSRRAPRRAERIRGAWRQRARRGASERRGAGDDGRRSRREARAGSDSERALDARGAGQADRSGSRTARSRHLHGCRPRARDGRRRRTASRRCRVIW